MISPSCFFTFLNTKKQIIIHLLEGQKLIHDLALTHTLSENGLSYFRNCLLSIGPMVAFLKKQERFGLYVEAKKPFFKLNFEADYHGQFRTLLLPEHFDQSPSIIEGKARLIKFIPDKRPITSHFNFENHNFTQLLNNILQKSFQINAQSIVGQKSDHSLLFSLLPEVPNKLKQDLLSSVNQGLTSLLNSIPLESFSDLIKLKQHFTKNGFILLHEAPLIFSCPCSQQRMIRNLKNMRNVSIPALFKKSKKLVIKCDYCKRVYQITQEDVFADGPTTQ